MTRLRAAAVVLGAAAALTAVPLSTAQAAPGDTATLCSSSLTPSGWVDVQWWNSFSCGSTFNPNIRKVQQLTGYAAGTTVTACASSLPPAGWVAVSISYNSGCVYAPNQGFNKNSWQLKQLTGYPVGTVVNACSSMLPPAGWVSVGEYYDGGCQPTSTPSTAKNAWQLKRVS
ncbi:hypothetical protein [Kitasatospora sp. MBT63]|uniref:hypothetical protein n=1 Tax=Kitasatospora sp. MBT63 TaxID=1444768 RepID=UPI000690411C|nr:hypothetical protein [Kitasatospora sp. MBT63]